MDKLKKILLIQLKRAGDVLVTTPVIAALKKQFPDAQIDFLVEKPFAPLLENNASLSRIRIYDKAQVLSTWRNVREARYDWVFDFQSSPRSALLCLFSRAKVTAGYRVPFWGQVYKKTVRRPGARVAVSEGKFSLVEAVIGPLPHDQERHLYLTMEEKLQARLTLPGDSPPIGLIPTHRHAIRQWHGRSFVTLAQRLLDKRKTVWWFWGPGEETYVRSLADQAPGTFVIPPTSLRQMAGLLSRCRYVVTNDNGPMHLATAVGVPTITIYGPTDPSCWNPGGQRHRAITAESLGCLGCNFERCPFDHECMTRVTPDQVEWVVDDLERTLPR